MLVICTFPNILRTNFNISPCYSGHLACSRSEINEAVLHSRFQVFQLLFCVVGKFSLSQSRKANCLTPGRPPHIRSTSSPSSTEFVKEIFSDLDSIMSSCTTSLLDTCCLATWHTRLWNNRRQKHVQISSLTDSRSEKIKHIIHSGHNLMHRNFVATLHLPAYPMEYPRRLVRSNYYPT
jgi:hypothetical protein